MIKTSLFANHEREAKLNQLGDALQVMELHVDFAARAAELDLAAPRPSRERGGRPPFPTELVVRMLLIQQLFNLSDEKMEFQLLDRLSFQRFVGLRASSQIPDRTTIWTFKERPIQADASERVFDAVNRQLARPRHDCARWLDDRREHRAGAQAVAEQGRESHRQRRRDDAG
ncbi:transposase [Noviherbaspirillum sp. 1P10PC]|uniref:transposase n=1 Tax=Noviherbaspirillum sp. 1P10PC TaxID=3132292 RepID=UPI0039A09838